MKRTAIIAGASGALGEAVCRRLSADEFHVVCGYAGSRERAERLAAALGGSAVRLAAGTDLGEALRPIYDVCGSIDVLVNAAGLNREAAAPGMTPEAWGEVLDVNLTFAFALTQAVLPYMMFGRYGRIVHLSSVSARVGGRGQINYAASKAALERMVRVLALEMGRKGVTVNCVAPGVIVSDMSARVRAEHGEALLESIACRRFGLPEEVAAAVAFLAGEHAGYITGAVLPVDGGMLL